MMRLAGEVVKIEKTESMTGKEQRRITVDIPIIGEATLTLPVDKAKPYTLGRLLDIDIEARR